MIYVYPDYYRDFECIKGECRHNCCIGWEIDIDDKTLNFYKTVSEKMGEKLKNNISFDEQPHFILSKDERCPFLNQENLCDIIINLGEEHLCNICADHPRFRNELPDRTEVGLGLSCEAAARLIIGKKTPAVLIGNPDTEDKIILLRDKIIKILQNRKKDITDRISDMLLLCNCRFPDSDMAKWAQKLLELERLDEEWTKMLTLLKDKWNTADTADFDDYMKNRQTEYEQLAVYMIYRHFANAFDERGIAERASFAAFAVMLIRAVGAVMRTKNGHFDFEEQLEIIRQFSAEIEYSDENLYILFDELSI